jgi:DNA repair exonuclease SbcCD ATPase subunit
MNEEIESATPADAQAEQVQQVEQVQGEEATTEQTQAAVEETPEEKAKREPWFQKRIGELTRDKYEAKRQADNVAQEAAQLREQLARYQAGEQPETQTEDVHTLARQEAQKMLAEQTFNDTCNRVYAAGKAEFPDFDNAVANLQMVGVNRDFLELATTSDAGAKLIHHLGGDLDEAARIASLPPVQMARELTRLEYKLAQAPAPKPVSKAPAPITPIGSGNATSFDPATLSDAEWHQRAYLKNRK